MRRSDHLRLKMTPEIRSLLECAAALEGRTVNEFAVTALIRAAQAAVQNGDVIPLSKAAQEAFARALIDPPPPNEALVRAFVRERRMFRKLK
ncbi:DUF1778 domain-containing protein [Achromobacter xylosoxidans]|uniref:type II toxin-antitoxin system TacA family antitoxin n=1 Tax=Alcaligenes xylosoxydans xylosoxydans TaxID=85698 RepID=UPI0012DCCA46